MLIEELKSYDSKGEIITEEKWEFNPKTNKRKKIKDFKKVEK